MARKDNAAAERCYRSRRCVADSGNTNAVRGLANLIASSRRKKPPRLSFLSASQRRSIEYIERSKMTVRRSRRKRWKARVRRRPQNCNRRRLALDPGSVVTYRLPRFVAGRAARPCRCANALPLAQQKPNDPEQAHACAWPSGSDRGPGGAGASQYPTDQPVEQQYSGAGGPIAK